MKAKYGALVVAGSGKINGFVASRNRGGAYFRTKVSPVNPQTTAQLTVRNRLGFLSQAWRGLTDAQRAAWNGVVSNFSKTDVFGDLKNPSGFNLYQRLNNNLLTTGQADIDVPPVPEAVADVALVSITATAGASTIAVVLSAAVPATSAVKVFATAPQSPGVTFVKNEYRLITILDPSDATPVALGTFYVAKFGSWAVGQKLWFKFVFVDITTGLESLPVQGFDVSA